MLALHLRLSQQRSSVDLQGRTAYNNSRYCLQSCKNSCPPPSQFFLTRLRLPAFMAWTTVCRAVGCAIVPIGAIPHATLSKTCSAAATAESAGEVAPHQTPSPNVGPLFHVGRILPLAAANTHSHIDMPWPIMRRSSRGSHGSLDRPVSPVSRQDFYLPCRRWTLCTHPCICKPQI